MQLRDNHKVISFLPRDNDVPPIFSRNPIFESKISSTILKTSIGNSSDVTQNAVCYYTIVVSFTNLNEDKVANLEDSL